MYLSLMFLQNFTMPPSSSDTNTKESNPSNNNGKKNLIMNNLALIISIVFMICSCRVQKNINIALGSSFRGGEAIVVIKQYDNRYNVKVDTVINKRNLTTNISSGLTEIVNCERINNLKKIEVYSTIEKKNFVFISNRLGKQDLILINTSFPILEGSECFYLNYSIIKKKAMNQNGL